MVDMVKAKATATSKIAAEGQAVTLISFTEGAYDVATGTSTPTQTETTRYGLLFDLAEGESYRGNLIEQSDRRLLMDAEGTLSPKDHIIVDGTEYKIVSVGGLNPSGTQIFYEPHLRV